MNLRNSWLLLLLLFFPPAIATGLGFGQDAPGTKEPPADPAKVAPPFKTAHSDPLDAKESVVDTADDYTRFRVEFNGIKGDRVPAYLYVPKRKDKTTGPMPAILLQYGIGGNKTTNYIVAMGKQFVARGFVVLTIDAPDVGERKTKEKKTPALLGLFGGDQVLHYCGDYSRAIDFLASRKDVDKDRIGYVGISWGAITGITFVAHEPRVKAMASLVGGGNFLGAFTPEAAAEAAKEGSKSSDPVYHVARIAPRPLLFINVNKDQLILRPWAESLHKTAGAGAKVVWLDTDHYFKGLDRTEVGSTVIDFMEKSLPPADRQK